MKKLVVAIIFVFVIFTNDFSTVEAGNLDTYRDLLARNTLTLKYENITPLPRPTNKDKVNFYSKHGMDVNKIGYFTNRQLEGIVVINGADKYEEVGYGNNSICSLTKGDKVYSFSKIITPNKIEYYGADGKKNKVSAEEKDLQSNIVGGPSYADASLTRVLSAILPPNQKSLDMPKYEFVGSGWLDNGLNYEDYKTFDRDSMEVIRYYFNGYTLVKIAAASYYTLPDGKLDGDKVIIKIKEFSPTPDLELLSLPSSIKDVTKK